MLKRVFAFLTSRWFVTMVGAVSLSALVWFGGPLVEVKDVRYLEDETVRFLVVLCIMAVWGVSAQFRRTRDQRANQRLVAALTPPPSAFSADATAVDEEVEILRERLRTAIGRLKTAKLGAKTGGRYLYQLPWYVLIGAPGAGKTTAIANSGLEFPLAGEFGRGPVQDVAGTLYCDWWFTNEAVLIDTAGRYTTQESRQGVDGPVWIRLLELLKKHRARQPLNGVLVMISIEDLTVSDTAERDRHIRAIKQRLQEVSAHIGVRCPVYVVFTKLDRIAGFSAMFDSLPRNQRDQVWGVTLPYDDGRGTGPALDAFPAGFAALAARLGGRVMERLHQELELERRGFDFTFPAAMATLQEPVVSFLRAVFQPNPYEERLLLRGVYFTSSVQQGAPIDRLADRIDTAFGVMAPPPATMQPSATSFFVNGLLRNVVFAEAGVVGLDRRVERARVWRERAALIALTLALAGFGAVWMTSYVINRRTVTRTDSAVAEVERTISAFVSGGNPLGAVRDVDFRRIVPLLNQVANLPKGYAGRERAVSQRETFGLYQGDYLSEAALMAYRRALTTLLLPRMLFFLEKRLDDSAARYDFLYDELRIYLMLGGMGPLDAILTERWMALEWLRLFPAPADAALRDDLGGHLRALIEAGYEAPELDVKLIERTRKQLASFPLAQRAYAEMFHSDRLDALPDWRLVDKAGGAAARVFVRPSGKLLAEGVPGYFTYDGYYGAVRGEMERVANDMAKEEWVLGESRTEKDVKANADKLLRQIKGLYLDDYARAWDMLLADIAIVPFRSIDHATEVLNSLAGRNSPLRLLLQSVTAETMLIPSPEEKATRAAAQAAGIAGSSSTGTLARAQTTATKVGQMAKLVGVPASLTPENPPEQAVNDRFRTLHAFVEGNPGSPPPIEDMTKAFGDLYDHMSRVASAPDQGAALISMLAGEAAGGPGGSATSSLLRLAGGSLPGPVAKLLKDVADSGARVSTGGARAQINGAWAANVLPLCRAALEERYPLIPAATVETSSTDFSTLFRPNGLFDQFFNTQLKPFVDVTVRPWRWQAVDSVSLGIPASTLTIFEAARDIRDGWFADGSPVPKVSFELTPRTLDAAVSQVTLDLDGQGLTYAHGPQTPMLFTWPGPGGRNQIRVAFAAVAGGPPSAQTKTGPWALFRLLSESGLTRQGEADRYVFTVKAGDRKAAFELRATSVNNPFGRNPLAAIRCPAKL